MLNHQRLQRKKNLYPHQDLKNVYPYQQPKEIVALPNLPNMDEFEKKEKIILEIILDRIRNLFRLKKESKILKDKII